MRRYGALLAIGVTFALSCGTTTPAHAVTPGCSTVVSDDARVLSPAEIAVLSKHAAGLAAKTELRIRTERSMFTGTLNGDEGSLQQDCRWASSTGVRQPRLLVIMVATESRQMGIYPGTALVPTITQPIWLAIEQKDVRPHFARADWVGGLEAGIDALSSVLTNPVRPSTVVSAPASSAAAPSASAGASAGASVGAASAAASASADGQGSIQDNGSGDNPAINDPNGLLPANQGVGATSSGNGSGGAFIVVFVLAGIVVVAGAVFGLARGGTSGRRRGHLGPDGVSITPPFDAGSQNPGMFDNGGFDGGGDGGGGGSPSDGGGGSSGF